MTDAFGYTKILDSLKLIMKEKDLPLASIAKTMEISEATLKRGLSTGQLSLERLEKICSILEVNLNQILQNNQTASQKSKTPPNSHVREEFFELNEEQESFFVKNPECLTYFYALHFHNDLDRLKKDFALTDIECDRFLDTLAEYHLISFDEQGNIEIPFNGEIVWIEGGLLEQTFYPEAQSEFLDHNFSEKDEHFYFQAMELSPKTSQKFFNDLQKLIHKYESLSAVESEANVKFPEFGVLVALRPWTFSLFRKSNHGHLAVVENEDEEISA